MVVGGPTVVLDLGGLRIVSNPTFDDPGPHSYLTKTAGPAGASARPPSAWPPGPAIRCRVPAAAS